MAIPASIIVLSGSLIDLDITFVMNLAIFMVMFFLLRQILFRPVVRLIEARREATSGTKHRAGEMIDEARQLRDDVEKKLQEIRAKALAERMHILEEARQKERDLLVKAKDDGRRVVDSAKKDITSRAALAKDALRNEISPLADSVAVKILGRKV